MRFDQFVERWCMSYKPMLHEPGETSKNKRFFFVDNYASMTDFMNSIPKTTSPCVVMESNQEGMIKGGKETPEYTLYFMTKMESSKPDGRMAHAVKLEAKQHMLKFMAYLRHKIEMEEDKDLKYIDIDDVQYATVGPLFNGWYAVTITLSDVKAWNLCIDPNDYEEIDGNEA